MSAYVDNAAIAFGRMKMSHLIADTRDELFAVVDAIGVDRKWLQHRDRPDEHFDICASKRAQAIALGLAKEVDGRELVGVIRAKRAAGSPKL